MSFSLEPLLLMSMGPTCLCSAACVACSASLMLAASGAQNRTGAYTVGGIAVCMAVSGVVAGMLFGFGPGDFKSGYLTKPTRVRGADEGA